MDDLIVTVDGPVLRVVFNRPDRHNALTWDMWDGLHDACERADADPAIRLVALSGAGERAFVSDLGAVPGRARAPEYGLAPAPG